VPTQPVGVPLEPSAATTREQRLREYRTRGHSKVQGWLEPSAIELICLLAEAQVRAGVAGGVCEIGIHHGRLFILLHLLAPGRAAAYDLFENQSDNVDDSGRGDKAVFLENLGRHGGNAEQIVVRSCNSLHLRPADVLADAGPVRIFSVDGGHTPDITASDMALAEATLSPGGLLILDDFFNPQWPGVAEGATRYLISGASRLVPVCIGGNKFIFTNDAASAAAYRAAVSVLRGFAVKEQLAFGAPVAVVCWPDKSPLETWLAQSWLWRVIRGTGAGPLLRSVARRVLAKG
jgi:Methyltransferase domain